MRSSHSNLLLFEVTHSLNWQFAFDGSGRVAWFQLDDGLGSLVQASCKSLKFIQLFSLLLLMTKTKTLIRIKS